MADREQALSESDAKVIELQNVPHANTRSDGDQTSSAFKVDEDNGATGVNVTQPNGPPVAGRARERSRLLRGRHIQMMAIGMLFTTFCLWFS